MENNKFKINTNKTMVIETNYMCNLKCVHCYVPGSRKEPAAYLSFNDAVDVFKQMEDLGFKNILFTGGEPLANPEFDKIYEEAYNRGFIITIFTNAVLLNEKYKNLFTKKPPAMIRVSMFGGSRDSYIDVTGYDFFDKVRENILFLKSNGIFVKVKLPLLRQNYKDAKSIKDYFKKYNIPCKIEYRIIPRFDGDDDILLYRLTPEEIIEYEFKNSEHSIEEYINACNARDKNEKVRTIDYCVNTCQAFIINPDYNLQFCFFLRDHHISLREHSLAEAIPMLTDIVSKSELNSFSTPECSKCNRQFICYYCPGWAKNETGKSYVAIPFLCRLTELFFDSIEFSKELKNVSS